MQTGNEKHGHQRLKDKGRRVNERTRLGQWLFPPCCVMGVMVGCEGKVLRWTMGTKEDWVEGSGAGKGF